MTFPSNPFILFTAILPLDSKQPVNLVKCCQKIQKSVIILLMSVEENFIM
jgi:hypothetical protein